MPKTLFQTIDDPMRVFSYIRKYSEATGITKMRLETLDKLIHQVRHNLFSSREIPAWAKLRWNDWFIRMGAMALFLLADEQLDAEEFCSFLLKKHMTYGVEPLHRWGEMGIVIRMDSKVGRLHSLETEIGGLYAQEIQESRSDTLRDILGYSILGYLYHEERMNAPKTQEPKLVTAGGSSDPVVQPESDDCQGHCACN
jgi:hypothetical protein